VRERIDGPRRPSSDATALPPGYGDGDGEEDPIASASATQADD
jgi:hypothetical protein